MATVINLHEYSKIEDEAASWIAQIDNDPSKAKTEEFRDWLTTSQQHYETFLALAEFWDFTEQIQFLDIKNIHSATSASNIGIPEKVRPYQFWHTAVAASIFLFVTSAAAILAFSLYSGNHDTVRYSVTLESGNHRLEEALPDGSSLILNAQSTVDISYTDNYRNITLKKGDIFIDVSPDRERPLTVHASGYFFRAVGTQFSVSTTRQEGVEMIVTEGSVMYGKGDIIVDNEKSNSKPIASLGAQVVSEDYSFNVTKLSLEELESKLSWRSGILKFHGEPLQQVLHELTRYSDREFIILSNRIKNERIIGRFQTGDMNTFLTMLEENFDVHWYQVNNTVFLTERR